MKGDDPSPFVEAESAESDEEKNASKVAPVEQEASEKKQLDEAIMKQSSSGQKKLLKYYSKLIPLGRHIKQTRAQSLYYLYQTQGIPLLMNQCLR